MLVNDDSSKVKHETLQEGWILSNEPSYLPIHRKISAGWKIGGTIAALALTAAAAIGVGLQNKGSAVYDLFHPNWRQQHSEMRVVEESGREVVVDPRTLAANFLQTTSPDKTAEVVTPTITPRSDIAAATVKPEFEPRQVEEEHIVPANAPLEDVIDASAASFEMRERFGPFKVRFADSQMVTATTYFHGNSTTVDIATLSDLSRTEFTHLKLKANGTSYVVELDEGRAYIPPQLFDAIIQEGAIAHAAVLNHDAKKGTVTYHASFDLDLMSSDIEEAPEIAEEQSLREKAPPVPEEKPATIYEQPFCGDGTVNFPDEKCDGEKMGLSSCDNFDHFIGGELRCNDDCTVDTSGCIEGTLEEWEALQKPRVDPQKVDRFTGPICGDGRLSSPWEECDGERFGKVSGHIEYVNGCADISDFVGGELSCNPPGTYDAAGNDIGCTFDTSGCETGENELPDTDSAHTSIEIPETIIQEPVVEEPTTVEKQADYKIENIPIEDHAMNQPEFEPYEHARNIGTVVETECGPATMIEFQHNRLAATKETARMYVKDDGVVVINEAWTPYGSAILHGYKDADKDGTVDGTSFARNDIASLQDTALADNTSVNVVRDNWIWNAREEMICGEFGREPDKINQKEFETILRGSLE